MSSDGQRITVDNKYIGDFVPLLIDTHGGNATPTAFTGYNYPTFRHTDVSQKPIHKIQEAPKDPTIGRIILTQNVQYKMFLATTTSLVTILDSDDNNC